MHSNSKRLWLKEINAVGGLMLKACGKRVPIGVVECDDRSGSEEAVRATGCARAASPCCWWNT